MHVQIWLDETSERVQMQIKIVIVQFLWVGAQLATPIQLFIGYKVPCSNTAVIVVSKKYRDLDRTGTVKIKYRGTTVR